MHKGEEIDPFLFRLQTIRDHTENVLAVLTNADALKKFNKNQARAKHLIMDGVKDHVVPHMRCGYL